MGSRSEKREYKNNYFDNLVDGTCTHVSAPCVFVSGSDIFDVSVI